MLNWDPNRNPRIMGMEMFFYHLLCGNLEPLMKPLMKSLMKSLMKPLLFVVPCATHELLMKPLMVFSCATHDHS